MLLMGKVEETRHLGTNLSSSQQEEACTLKLWLVIRT